MKNVLVLGIFVADISFSGDKIPSVGETIIGNEYNIGPGGKGSNQAIAIAKLGGSVKFISKIGNDNYGNLALETLKKNNIDTSNVIISKKEKTGVAGIMIEKKTGKNAINVITGAPSSFEINEIDFNLFKKCKIFLTQLEIPQRVTLECLRKAKEFGSITILNPAPAHKLNEEFFKLIDYFTPNETEAEFYSGIKINNEKDAKESAKRLHNLGLKKVVITLGEKGVFYSDSFKNIFIKALPLKDVVDTTGAGDAFNGGLAYALLNNKSIEEALNLANQVAGLSTLGFGAGGSMPSIKDVNSIKNI